MIFWRRAFGAPLLLALTLQGGTALAADAAGKFALKGAGPQKCSALLSAYEKKSGDLALYAGWIDGYLTGLNQAAPETYDLAAWQGADTLLAMTRAACQQMPPETRVIDAFTQIVLAIRPGRIAQEEGLIALMHDGKGTAVYGSVLIAAKRRLNALGHAVGTENMTFDKTTAAGFQSYQKAEGIPETGLPDQQTLYHLLRAR